MTKQTHSARKKPTNLLIKCLIAVMFITGIGIFSYPFFVDSLNNYLDQKMVEKHQQETAAQNQKNREKVRKKMVAENAKKSEATGISGLGLLEELFDTTNLEENYPATYYEEHLLGALYIPKIRTSLPIFSETNQALLEKGTTLLQGTSYPIGGTSTHSVITGHTGLPQKMIFTDLEKLKKGDQFYLDILDERLAYQVDQIQVVSPDNLEVLAVQKGRDLVTLLTCTPYMINSHRLLVTGVRIPYKEKMGTAINQTKRYQFWRLSGLIVLLVGILGIIFYWIWRKVVLFRAAKKTYKLQFFNSEPTLHQFQLLQKDGTPVLLGGKPVIESKNVQGEVCFSEIPGGIYKVSAFPKNEQLLFKAKVWRVHDPMFRLIGKRNQLIKKNGKYLLVGV